jgi:serine/threonine protein kinase
MGGSESRSLSYDEQSILDKLSFNVVKKLGQGQYGEVYEVFKKSDPNIHLAAKFVKYKNDSDLITYQREAYVLNFLKKNCKKYILCYEDYFYDEELRISVLSTEYIPNSINLTAFIGLNFKLFKRKFKLSLMLKLVTGLKTLHDLGVVHKDIKPDNIMIYKENEQFYIKYIDYGLACINPDLEQSIEKKDQMKECLGVIAGSAYYMSPEVYNSYLDTFNELKQSDIWSLGIVLAEIAYGIILTKNSGKLHNILDVGMYTYNNLINGHLDLNTVFRDNNINPDNYYIPLFNKIFIYEGIDRINSSEIIKELKNMIDNLKGDEDVMEKYTPPIDTYKYLNEINSLQKFLSNNKNKDIDYTCLENIKKYIKSIATVNNKSE